MSAGHDDRPTGPVPADTSAPDYLEILGGPEDGKRILFHRDALTIGRADDNDACIPLELSVSRHHARLIRHGSAYRLEIFPGARNPARVGGQTVPPGQAAPLARGETFTLGDVLLELSV